MSRALGLGINHQLVNEWSPVLSDLGPSASTVCPTSGQRPDIVSAWFQRRRQYDLWTFVVLRLLPTYFVTGEKDLNLNTPKRLAARYFSSQGSGRALDGCVRSVTGNNGPVFSGSRSKFVTAH